MHPVEFTARYRTETEGDGRKLPHIKIEQYTFANRNYLLLDDEMRFSAYVRLPEYPTAGVERRETMSRRFFLTFTRGEPSFEGPTIDLVDPINGLQSELWGNQFRFRNAEDPVTIDVVVTAVQNPAGDPVFHDEDGDPIDQLHDDDGGLNWPDVTPFDTQWTPNSGEAFGTERVGTITVDPSEFH